MPRCGCNQPECALVIREAALNKGHRYHPDCISRKCKCGCGLSVPRAPGNRLMYAPTCKSGGGMIRRTRRARFGGRELRDAGIPESMLGRPRVVIVCKVCYDLPHRREESGCPACRRPCSPSP